MKKFKMLIVACLAVCVAFVATGCSNHVVMKRYVDVDERTLGYRLMGDGSFYLFNDGEVAEDWPDYFYESSNDVVDGRPWNDRLGDIKKVVIGDNISALGEYAFYNAASLKEVVIGRDVESIGLNAFKNCYNLSSITVDKDNPYFSMEDGCLVQLSTGKLIRATSKTEITVPAEVKTMEDGAFYGLGSLKKVDMSQSSLTTINDDAFRNCTSLSNVVLPEGLKTIGSYAFFKCSSLSSIDLQDCDKLSTIGVSAFYGCSSLKKVEFAKGVTKIGMLAFSRSGLEQIHIPATNARLSIGSNAFYECNSLGKVYLASMALAASAKNSAEVGYLFANTYKAEKYNVVRNIKIYIAADQFDIEKLGAYIANGQNFVRLSDNETVDGIEYVVYKGL